MEEKKNSIFYSKGVKSLIVILLIVGTLITAFSGCWLAQGFANGLSVQDIQETRSYVQSNAALSYLQDEASSIASYMEYRGKYMSDGVNYDGTATIDITENEKGVRYTDKNSDTEYTLNSVKNFYNSEGMALLDFLLMGTWDFESIDDEALSADSYYDDIYVKNIEYCVPVAIEAEQAETAEETDTASLDAVESDQPMGTAEASTSADSTTESAKTTVDSTGTTADAIADSVAGKPYYLLELRVETDNSRPGAVYKFKVYSDYSDTLLVNGYAIENSFIKNVNGKTLAENSVLDTESAFSGTQNLLELYQFLMMHAQNMNEMIQDKTEDTNAMLYIYDQNSGAIFTNVEDWNGLTLEEVVKNYNAYYASGNPCYMADKRVIDGVSETDIQGISRVLDAQGDLEMFGDQWTKELTGADKLGSYDIFLGLNMRFPNRSSYSYSREMFMEQYTGSNIGKVFCQLSMPLFILGWILMIVTMILIGVQAGRRSEDRQIHKDWTCSIPLELVLIGGLIFIVIGGLLMTEGLEGSSIYRDYYGVSLWNCYYRGLLFEIPGMLIVMGTGAFLIHNIGLRLKLKALEGSLIKSTHKMIRKTWNDFYEARKANQKMIVDFVIFAGVHMLAMLFMAIAIGNYAGVIAFLILILLAIFDVKVLKRRIRGVQGRDALKKGMEEIASGNMNYKVSTANMSEENRILAEQLNQVQEGLKKAVESEMKSERLKADLITNVSHDIKTPLTSIINYVDLLKREHIADPKIAGYIDVLDRKSARLKQLTEDLVESSKISSGNITLEWQEFNLKQLIKQTNGEFAEKFENRSLQLVCELPEEDMRVCADTRRMYRVLENLYNNAAKYAMPNSRVYVKGELTDEKVIVSIKNMSENPLNFSADELMERFVRGDVSRNTEGSGLGLEISRNLTLLQNGTFDIYLDGDMFKVTLTFDRCAPQPEEL